jgi:hypothetical protein
MHFARTEEQDELAAAVRGLLQKRSDSAAVRAAIATEAGYDESLWQTLCEQVGVAALAVPEKYDGFGATLVETAVVLEVLGEFLTPTPLLATTLSTVQLLLTGTDADKADRLPGLAAGDVLPFELGGVVLEPVGTGTAMDQTMRLAIAAEPVGLSADLRAISVALTTALQVGGMQRALDTTVGYSQERVQFGRQIGSFQALKHRFADAYLSVERATSLCYFAALTIAEDDPRRAQAASLAKAAAGDCQRLLVGEGLQLHGGVGFTWEHDLHFLLKRAKTGDALLGNATYHRSELARMLGLTAAVTAPVGVSA